MDEQALAALPVCDVDGEPGRGAFGAVYSARHTQLDRDVLSIVSSNGDTLTERFVFPDADSAELAGAIADTVITTRSDRIDASSAD